MIKLSQGHLNLLETCPPQWQKVYLEELALPKSPDKEEKLAWGNRFHLLMQQRELGLEVESLLTEDQDLEQAFTALVSSVPELSWHNNFLIREAEHYRTLPFDNYLLTVIYDLLIADEEKAQILDWKTYLQPENKSKLANNWQTRLYLYVLAETSHYLPEQISFTYWFVKLPSQPQSVKFNYNSKLHEKTRQDLSNLLGKLDNWLADYLENNISFPHLTNCEETCSYYKYLVNSQETNNLKSITEIKEVSI